MTFQPGYAAYTQGFGTAPAGVNFPFYGTVAPTSTNVRGNFGVFQLGQEWIVPNVGAWILIGLSTAGGILSATWEQMVSATGDVLSVTGTANQVLASPTTGNVFLSLIGPYTPATYTEHGTLVGEGTESIVAIAPGSAGQFYVSNGESADPSFQTATPQLVVTPVAGATQAMTSNHTYIANDASLTTFTLPTTSAVGDILQITGSELNSGGWTVTYTTGQIIWGPAGHSTATTGNAASATAAAQSMTMVCVVANTTWVITANSGTITLT
jgi:hypothetical protein